MTHVVHDFMSRNLQFNGPDLENDKLTNSHQILTLSFLASLCGITRLRHFRGYQAQCDFPEQIRLPDGFKIELLYSVPREDQGSWVAMCQDDKGRLIVSDQHGGLYRFPIPKVGERVDPASIQPITYSIVGAKARKSITGTDPSP